MIRVPVDVWGTSRYEGWPRYHVIAQCRSTPPCHRLALLTETDVVMWDDVAAEIERTMQRYHPEWALA